MKIIAFLIKIMDDNEHMEARSLGPVGGARDDGRTSSGQKRAHGDRPKNADFGGRKGASAGRGSNRSGSRTGGAASSFNGRPSGRGGNGRPQGKTVS